ncbi:MAG: glycosyltransferase family 2 protein [Xenococcaceae cyanobacterium MO_188.B29]|nr:glycosyltransferase family 2 protein [Xenococcaceae cyanobacterium MO_188.B29]
MKPPILSIIIPTYSRPQLLPRAVESALAQTVADIEVIVVDDASPEPVQLPEHEKLRVIRLPVNGGGSVARNTGAKAARGLWITFLDDDDTLLPTMAEVSLAALVETDLPKPVAVISGIKVVDENGEFIKKRIPPTLPKGSHFQMEKIAKGKSFLCKQTMVVERDVLLSIGGFDESFRSRVHSELFLRLNSVCSILGIPDITYQLYKHGGSQVTKDVILRQVSFNKLMEKHQSIFKQHPQELAKFIFEHARRCYELGHESGQTDEALFTILGALSWGMRLAPEQTLSRLTDLLEHQESWTNLSKPKRELVKQI